MYTTAVRRLLLLSGLLVSSTNAFLFSKDATVTAANPFLSKFAETQTSQLLHIDLDIAPPTSAKNKSENVARMYVSNMVVELKNCPPPHSSRSVVDELERSARSSYVPFPSAKTLSTSTTNPKVSSGSLMLNVDTPGSFISLSGTQQVNFGDDSTWEMRWKENQPAGFILCGLALEEEVRRNDAVLSPGNVYMNLPIWTREGLTQMRKIREEKEQVYSKFLSEKKSQLKRSDESSNPLQKIYHFQRATVADEKLYAVNLKRYQHVPMEDHEMISIGNDLFLQCKGTVWTKQGSRKGFLQLGHANVKKVESSVPTL